VFIDKAEIAAVAPINRDSFAMTDETFFPYTGCTAAAGLAMTMRAVFLKNDQRLI
jgi:hypothetical protein